MSIFYTTRLYRIKILFLLLLIAGFLLSNGLMAQVAGVSASKLTAIDATLVAPKTLEAEPSYTYLFSRKSFDGRGNLYAVSSDADSAVILKDMFFRFTYGVNSRLEIGTFITSNLSSFSFGAKYRFVKHEKFMAVALLGLNFSNESNFGIRKTGFFGKYLGISTGLAFTGNFTDRLSLDVSAQYQYTFCYEGALSNNYFIDSDIGYYIFNHTLQLAGGFSFQYNRAVTDAPDSYSLSFHPGVTIEPGRSFLIVFYTPFDLIGKNLGRFSGFSFAFTFTIQ